MSSNRFTITDTFERNRRRLWALCWRLTRSRPEADDLVQEAAVRAIERADQITDADPTGWLFTLTTRLCLDHLRRRKAAEHAASASAASESSPPPPADEALVLHENVRFVVRVSLQALPPRQRAALLLHTVLGWPLDEVAAALQLNANATKALLHRARAALAPQDRR